MEEVVGVVLPLHVYKTVVIAHVVGLDPPVVSRAIEALPPNQREVIRLRDVLGWPSSEVRNALDISETNQRVLLHRARTKVRRALESYLRPEEEQGA